MRTRALNSTNSLKSFAVLACGVLIASFVLSGQTITTNPSTPRDPGVRDGGPGNLGNAIPGLTASEQALFNTARGVFAEIDSVSGTEPGAPGKGLGPSFNMNSCAGCHAQPALGGSSPANNPQIAVATLFGADNRIPSFLSAQGPVREARFIKNADGTPDGGVHDLFTTAGRADAGTCGLGQTDFTPQVNAGNVIFRVPTPVFGAGLIEAISDSTILNNANANQTQKQNLGISGHANFSGNDGTITRFGWKAQNKSLLIFAGEAYNVEQGVTNE